MKEDDLAVGLAAGLESDAELIQRGVADVGTMFEYTTAAVRATDDQAAFADRGENGVAMAVGEKRSTLSRILEQLDGLAVTVRQGRRGRHHHRHTHQECTHRSHRRSPADVTPATLG